MDKERIFGKIFWRLKASIVNKIIPDFTAFIIGKKFSQMIQEKISLKIEFFYHKKGPRKKIPLPKISTFSQNKHFSHNKHAFFGLTKICLLWVGTVKRSFSRIMQNCWSIMKSRQIICQEFKIFTPTLSARSLRGYTASNRFFDKPCFWISCMIFRYYPLVLFYAHFWNQHSSKKIPWHQKKFILDGGFS